MGKKKRNTYPDIPERLAAPIVDNHTHLPVREDRDYAALMGAEGGDAAREADDANGFTATVDASSAAGPAMDASADRETGEQAPADLLPGSIPWHLDRMSRAGVRHAITSGCEVPTLEPTVRLAETHEAISAAIAIHPNDAPLHRGITEKSPDGMEHGLDPWHREYSLEDAVTMVADLARSMAVVCIGETGLDYFRTADAGKTAQAEAFRLHIELAKDLDLPLQIHDREAHEDCIRILKECGAPQRTVFHCFSGDEAMARVLAENGWYASFAGTITYPANQFLRDAFLALPDELIMVETDAPYLTPVPFRGHPNAPYAAAFTARFMAELRGRDEAQWCERLNRTANEVYGV